MDFLEKRSDDSIRKELLGIRDSYHHDWDLLAELLQNSRDAINRKRKAGGTGPFFIQITVDATTNRIEVLDNGVGIPESKIHEMLAPGGGDKDGTGEEVGEKGVGLTYAVFSGNRFEIESRVKDKAPSGGSVDNAQTWLNAPGPSARPVFTALSTVPATPPTILLEGKNYPLDTYTKIAVSGILPPQGDLNFFSMTEQQLKVLLRSRTAVGVTRSIFDSNAPGEFDTYLSVHLPGGKSYQKLETKYLAPHDLVASSSLVSLDDVRKAFLSRADPVARRKYLNGKAVWSVKRVTASGWDIDVYGVMLTDNDAFKLLAKDSLGVVSTDDDEANGTALFQSGIYVGTKGMPTGMRIGAKPGGRYPAYYKRCLFFVESSALKFDLGRKSLHYRYIHRLQSAVASMFDEFEQIAQYQGDAKIDPGVPQQTKAERLAKIEADWTEANQLPELGDSSIPYKKHPNRQEAAVAAVFHELLGAKVISGYETLSTGYSAQYDLHALYTAPGKAATRCTVEFKYNLDSLIRDLLEKQKHFQEIDLLVAWDADELKLKAQGFDLSPVTHGSYDGVTHMLMVPISGIDDIPVILLRQFIYNKNKKSP